MPRWLRMLRGMIGTGLVFGLGVGAVATLVGLAAVVARRATLDDVRFAGRLAVAAFLLGVAFSGILAIVGRRRSFDRISLPAVTALGAGAGVIYWLLIGINAFHVWSLQLAIGNLVLLTLLGGGSAA